nr:WAS/WASL-interacting protein family member 2-like [Equus asinus]
MAPARGAAGAAEARPGKQAAATAAAAGERAPAAAPAGGDGAGPERGAGCLQAPPQPARREQRRPRAVGRTPTRRACAPRPPGQARGAMAAGRARRRARSWRLTSVSSVLRSFLERLRTQPGGLGRPVTRGSPAPARQSVAHAQAAAQPAVPHRPSRSRFLNPARPSAARAATGRRGLSRPSPLVVRGWPAGRSWDGGTHGCPGLGACVAFEVPVIRRSPPGLRSPAGPLDLRPSVAFVSAPRRGHCPPTSRSVSTRQAVGSGPASPLSSCKCSPELWFSWPDSPRFPPLSLAAAFRPQKPLFLWAGSCAGSQGDLTFPVASPPTETPSAPDLYLPCIPLPAPRPQLTRAPRRPPPTAPPTAFTFSQQGVNSSESTAQTENTCGHGGARLTDVEPDRAEQLTAFQSCEAQQSAQLMPEKDPGFLESVFCTLLHFLGLPLSKDVDFGSSLTHTHSRRTDATPSRPGPAPAPGKGAALANMSSQTTSHTKS